MSNAATTAGNSVLGRRRRDQSEDGLQVGGRKKLAGSDPLTRHGRHFGRAVYAFSNIRALVTNGLIYMGLEDVSLEDYNARERRELAVFEELLKICPGLEKRLLDAVSTDEIQLITDLIQKGANASRADDTKGMKATVIDWITPAGENLALPLSRRHKNDRGFHHETTGALLCPANLSWADPVTKKKLRDGELVVAGHNWPIFLYQDSVFDAKDPWKGLLKSQLLVTAFKHVFISPSAADSTSNIAVTTKNGNARINGMKRTTKASIVYIATQVRFALSSAGNWSRTDKVTDSENFYYSLLEALDDPANAPHATEILVWWDKKIFPHSRPDAAFVPVTGSPLDCIRQMQAEREAEAARDTAS